MVFTPLVVNMSLQIISTLKSLFSTFSRRNVCFLNYDPSELITRCRIYVVFQLFKPLFALLVLYRLSDPVFSQMKSNSQALGADIQFGALNKVIFCVLYVLTYFQESTCSKLQ